jgi:hypothetical protein
MAPSGLLARLPGCRPAMGEPARLPDGVPLREVAFGGLSFNFFLLDSFVSLLETAPASTSLPEFAPLPGMRTRFVPVLFLLGVGFGMRVGIGAGLVGRTWMADGDIGRDGGWDVGLVFLGFLRDVSVPLASEVGEPSLFRPAADFLRASVCLGRPEGVLVPLDEASFSFSASVFLRSSSFAFSVSVSSEL